MSAKKPQTIQVFLPAGEPRGIRIAEITTRTVKAIHIPRARLDEAVSRAEVQTVGVYFLIGQEDDRAKPLAYVGEAEDCLKRLKQQSNERKFWQHAVAVVSKTSQFTKTHAKYLEWYCIARAKEAARYTLQNGNDGSEPFTTEPMKAELMDAFEVLDILTAALGFPVVEVREAPEPDEVFYLERKQGAVKARGQMVDDGFLVERGAVGDPEVRQSAEPWVASLRQALIDDGVGRLDTTGLVFDEAYTFSSPSAAASVLLGGNTNGWVAWRDAGGRTLDQAKRAEDAS